MNDYQEARITNETTFLDFCAVAFNILKSFSYFKRKTSPRKKMKNSGDDSRIFVAKSLIIHVQLWILKNNKNFQNLSYKMFAKPSTLLKMIHMTWIQNYVFLSIVICRKIPSRHNSERRRQARKMIRSQ